MPERIVLPLLKVESKDYILTHDEYEQHNDTFAGTRNESIGMRMAAGVCHGM
jgi:hypothetical protein